MLCWGLMMLLKVIAKAHGYFRIADKMRVRSKEDKSAIICNGRITLSSLLLGLVLVCVLF